MHLFIVTDIFGINDAVKTIQKKLLKVFDKVSILDPYQGTEKQFTSEPQAYSEFLKLSGHELYLQTSQQQIIQSDEINCLLGFSAGATVCWRLSETLTTQQCKNIIAFYPSQIRKYLDIVSAVKTTVIFPQKEDLFSVEESIAQLNNKQNVSCHHSRYLHGFMNPNSTNYSSQAEEIYFSLFGKTHFFNNPVTLLNRSQYS